MYNATQILYMNKTTCALECVNLHCYLIFVVEGDEMLVGPFYGCELDSSLLPPTIVCHNLI